MKKLLKTVLFSALSCTAISQAAQQQETWGQYLRSGASSFWNAFTQMPALPSNETVSEWLESQEPTQGEQKLGRMRIEQEAPSRAPEGSLSNLYPQMQSQIALDAQTSRQAVSQIVPYVQQPVVAVQPKRFEKCSQELLEGYQLTVPYDADPEKAADKATAAFVADLGFQGSFVEQQEHWQAIYKPWVMTIRNYIEVLKNTPSLQEESHNKSKLQSSIQSLELTIEKICYYLTIPQQPIIFPLVKCITVYLDTVKADLRVFKGIKKRIQNKATITARQQEIKAGQEAFALRRQTEAAEAAQRAARDSQQQAGWQQFLRDREQSRTGYGEGWQGK